MKAQKARYNARYPEKIKARIEKLRARPLPPGFKAAQRKARKLVEIQRVPPWARSPAQRRAIAAVYAQAALLTASTGIKHEVDHVYPLRGKTVSGLHVAENLRAVPAAINNAKGAADPVAFMLS